MKRILIVLMAVAIGFSSCSSKKKSASKMYSSSNAIGTYKGTLPCADCSGIDYELNLKTDGTYEEKSLYMGKATTQNFTVGKWKMTSDTTLKLDKSTAGSDIFEVEEDGLWLLDMNGQRIKSSSADKYKLTREKSGMKGAWREKFKNGIDFLANGNEPSWYVEIDFEKNIYFKSLGDNAEVTAEVPMSQKTDKSTIYSAITTNGSLIVTIDNVKCNDAMSGEDSPYSVKVEYNNKTYKGCGRYFYDERLDANWILKTYKDGKIPEVKDFPKGLPTIDLQLKNKRVSGIAGCNSYSANFEIRGNRIDFTPMMLTKMMCKRMSMEETFTKLLGKDVKYEIINNELYLYDDKGRQWIFKKN